MDVRRAAGVGHRLDRPEPIDSVQGHRRPPVALEVPVEPIVTGCPRMPVDPLGVALPDFDNCAGDRPPGAVEDPSSDVGDGAQCLGGGPVNPDEVVVDVRGQAGRVERAFRLAGRRNKARGAGRSGEQGYGAQRGHARHQGAAADAAVFRHGRLPFCVPDARRRRAILSTSYGARTRCR